VDSAISHLSTNNQHPLVQAYWTFYLVQVTVAKFDLYAGKLKYNTQKEE
jgi:hypothetical protein